ncbi:hypothetical protein ACJMK2_038147 [Sinanodonta woodiana]|uniref:BPTI/Kunitz inhibitor domain-containing protein n=1 Tax=Sinanodonta woodiana TaxID=1069815 RepID=A0ABD3WPQ4_SINWO
MYMIFIAICLRNIVHVHDLNLPVCEQPKEEGTCRGYFPRWFYNRGNDRCEQFIYGGCQGNDNNFNTKEACVTRCPSRASSNVILPVSGKWGYLFLF